MTKSTGELSEESFAFTWKIPNFLDLPDTEDYYVTSPEFRFAKATWYLHLNTNYTWGCTKYIFVYLVRSQSSIPQHRIYHKIGLQPSRGEEYYSTSDERTFVNNSSLCVTYLLRSDITDKRQLLLPKGTLTVLFQIRVRQVATSEASSRLQQRRNEPSQTELQEASSQTEDLESVTQTELQEASSQTEVPESVIQTEAEEASASVQKLQSDYGKLLKSEEDSDVCLKVSDKEFRAHRCILRARSKVFSAMFKHETEEKASGEVVIDDLDPDSFPDFLQHVYAGRVESLSSKNVSSLYSAADKYDLQELKSECLGYMKRNLSVDTFCDVMTLALRHQEEDLLKLAIEFFTKNVTKIIVTVEWQMFSKDYNTEANELFIKALVPGEENDS